ncbi:MAG: hypothetical protein IKC97_03155 [Clostridia bacterium]|nr:hypothetical protein [Clostridia bacterium]
MHRNRITLTLSYILRGTLIYATFIWILHLSAYLLRSIAEHPLGMMDIFEETGLPLNPEPILHWLTAFILFYSVARAYTLADKKGYAMTTVIDGEDGPIPWGTVLDSAYLIESSTIVALYFIIPSSIGYHASLAWLQATLIPEVVPAKTTLLPFLIAYPFLLALAHRSVRLEWQKMRAAEHLPHIRAQGGIIAYFQKKLGLGGLLAALLLLVIVYPLGVMGVYVLIFPFVSYGKLLLQYWPVLLGIILAIAAIYYIRALRKRRRLILGMRKICAQKGYSLSHIRRPYLNLFFPQTGADFTLQTDKQCYECKMIGAVSGNRMLFDMHGEVKIMHLVRFRFLQRFRTGANALTMENALFSISLDYAFESDYKKCLIVCPTAPETILTTSMGNAPVDTGSAIGEYTVYSTTGFINAIDRDCLPE